MPVATVSGVLRILRWVIVPLTVTGAVTGCDSNSSNSDSAAAAIPVVNLAANPTTVIQGGRTTLTWSSTGADACEASGGWSGSQPSSGTFLTDPIDVSQTYTLSCDGAGGGTVARTTVNVAGGAAAPNVLLTASPPGVPVGGTTSLSWTSANVTACTASGAWSGARATSGTEDSGPIDTDQTFQLICDGPGGSALAMTTVTVRLASLSWDAPTENVDGTALDDLAGFNLYWGAASRSYGVPVALSDPNATSYSIELSAGTYYFAMTAFDLDGNESAFSNEVSKIIF